MIEFVGIDYCNIAAAGVIYDYRQQKQGGIKHGNCCDFGRHSGRRLHYMRYDIVRAASLDRRKNESEKMDAYQF